MKKESKYIKIPTKNQQMIKYKKTKSEGENFLFLKKEPNT